MVGGCQTNNMRSASRWSVPEDGVVSGLLDGVDGWGLAGRLALVNHAWNLGIGAWRASIGTLQLSQLDNDTAAAISKFCTNLRRFEITWGPKLDYACICSDGAITSVLKGCPRLQALDLANGGSSRAVLTAIAESCPQLLSLTLYCLEAAADYEYRPYVTAHLLADLCRGCPQLEALELRDCYDLDDEKVIAIARGCPRIQRIVHRANCACDENNVSDAALAAVGAECRQLREFRIEGKECGSSITDTGVEALARGCPLLHTLSIGGSGVTCEGITSLVTYCPLLCALVLSWCDSMSDAAIIALAQPGSRLAHLDLDYAGGPFQLTDVAMEALCRCRQLQTLGLGSNRAVTIAGVAQVLRACPHMTKVRLCGASGMTQDEVKALRREHPLVSLTRYADRDSCASLSLYGHHTERDEWVLRVGKPGPGRSGRMHVELRQAPSR